MRIPVCSANNVLAWAFRSPSSKSRANRRCMPHCSKRISHTFCTIRLKMLLVISPSKTQNFECRPHRQHTIPILLEESRHLMSQLKRMSVQEIAALMKISDRLAKLNWQRYQDFKLPFDLENARQALLLFAAMYTTKSPQTPIMRRISPLPSSICGLSPASTEY